MCSNGKEMYAVIGHSCFGVPANILSLCLFVFSFGEANKKKIVMHLKSSCFAILNLNIAFFCHSHCHPWIIVAYKAPYCKMHIELSRAGTFL